MAEVLFYHLLRLPLEAALPMLLERTLERGWRAVVQAASEERLAALDDLLWTYREDSFLPHGTDREAHAADQPVVLTTGAGNANGASVRFLVDGADLPDDWPTYRRLAILFDAADPHALAVARAKWRAVTAAGHEATYWQQDVHGRWERKA